MRRTTSARSPDALELDDDVLELPGDLDARSLLDRLPAILYVADTGIDGKWRYVSSGVLTILGFSPEEWIARADRKPFEEVVRRL